MSRFEDRLLRAGVTCVLFDLDGVLINTKGLHDAALLRAVSVSGFYVPVVPIWGDEGIRSSDKLSLLGIPPSAWDGIRELKSRHFLEMLDPDWLGWREDLGEVVEGLRAMSLLVTNCSWEHGVLAKVLKMAGLSWTFRQVFAAYDGRTRKPVLYKAARTFTDSLSCAPGKCLVVEDTESGVAAAMGAGFPVVDKVNFHSFMEEL